MQVVGVQLDIAWENKPANYKRVHNLLEGVEIAPGSLVVLPEMFATGFSMNVDAIREGPGAETADFLASIAKDRRCYALGGIVSLASDGRGLNEAVVVDSGGQVCTRYCKMHPFSYAGETNHYKPGDRVVTFKWNGFTISPFICYDLRFPEAFRQAAIQGANLLVVIACWPQPREAHWMALLKARAIENQAYVVGVNRCGRDPNAPYSGRSMILDPRGNVLADGGDMEGVIQAALDLPMLEEYRREFPALSDIRPEYKSRP